MPLDPDLFVHWFDPRRLFAEGYPKNVSSALKVFPNLAFEIQRIVVSIAPRRALEIGPGDRPVIGSVRGAVYLDVVPRFLSKIDGRRVQGDVREAPFRRGSFDLVVAADLFTHIPPADRALALDEILALAPRVILFNPEAGTPEVKMSPVPTTDLEQALRDAGLKVERRDFVAAAPGGQYRMALLYGERVE